MLKSLYKRKFAKEADFLQQEFVNAGILVSRKDVGINETFLELEYGSYGTIRISDHVCNKPCEYEVGPYIISKKEEEGSIYIPISLGCYSIFNIIMEKIDELKSRNQ